MRRNPKSLRAIRARIEQHIDLKDHLYGYMGENGNGSHVKLTVHADGATDADTKYKTFWVTGCEFQNSET